MVTAPGYSKPGDASTAEGYAEHAVKLVRLQPVNNVNFLVKSESQ